jgi:RNA polymerase-associated protein CTR9
VQASKLYERAQSQFYFNQNENVMLYQARAHYENGNLEEARKILRKALLIAPWNHRIRFNLAYVIQEMAQRTLNRTMKSTSSDGRLAQVESAIEDLTTALKLFEQLQTLGNQAEFGFDAKRTSVHVSFCKQALTKSKPHLEAAQKEEASISAAKNAQLTARRAIEEGRAAQKAAEELAKETHAKELEAIAAQSERRFKESQARWMSEQAVERPTKKGAKGLGAAPVGEATSDLSEDDDEPAPETRAPPTAEELARQKEALAAAGLADSDDEDEDEDEDAQPSADVEAPAEKKRSADETDEAQAEAAAPKRRRRAVVDDDDDE